MYRLKKNMESFQVVDGQFAGRSYRPGVAYDEIPPQEAGKFEQIKEAAPQEDAPRPVKTESKKGFPIASAAPEKEEVKT